MPTRDLSQPLNADASVYPGDPEIDLSPAATHEGDGYRVTEVKFGTHAGTHIDAPSHTESDGNDLDAFGVDRFAFDAQLVDCSGASAREAIGPDALPDDPDAELLVIRTGWDARWGTDRYFDHPYLDKEAAVHCAKSGCHVALDALSPDPSPSAGDSEGQTKSESGSEGTESKTEPDGTPAHHELLGRERFVVENLTGLGDLPERFELRAYPLPITGADGSPVRAVAVW